MKHVLFPITIIWIQSQIWYLQIYKGTNDGNHGNIFMYKTVIIVVSRRKIITNGRLAVLVNISKSQISGCCYTPHSQQARDIEPFFGWCWWTKHWLNVLCLLCYWSLVVIIWTYWGQGQMLTNGLWDHSEWRWFRSRLLGSNHTKYRTMCMRLLGDLQCKSQWLEVNQVKADQTEHKISPVRSRWICDHICRSNLCPRYGVLS